MRCFEQSNILFSPQAILHQPGDIGYIPMTDHPINFDINTPFAIVYDAKRDRILCAKGVEHIIYPASVTKLLTVLTALKVLSPHEIVYPGEELSMLDEDSSVAGIAEGHALTVEMLIEAMMLPSGNDAAYALAAAAGKRLGEGNVSGRDAVSLFIAFMHEYGRSIGMTGTHFIVPDGLALEEHYTTLEDVILLGKAAMDCPIIRRYASTVRDSVTYESGHTNEWTNTNPLLRPESPWYRSAVTGLKTGYLRHNSCILLSVQAKESYYLIGLFGAEDSDTRCADAVHIIDTLLGGEVTA